jgi:hypothetical protein
MLTLIRDDSQLVEGLPGSLSPSQNVRLVQATEADSYVKAVACCGSGFACIHRGMDDNLRVSASKPTLNRVTQEMQHITIEPGCEDWKIGSEHLNMDNVYIVGLRPVTKASYQMDLSSAGCGGD